MGIQTIIVVIIVAAALAYVGQIIWRKTKAFSSKSACGAGCGCASETKRKT